MVPSTRHELASTLSALAASWLEQVIRLLGQHSSIVSIFGIGAIDVSLLAQAALVNVALGLTLCFASLRPPWATRCLLLPARC